MSYICLIANKNGAVVAADSRITIDTPIPGIHFHRDNGCKVFAAKQNSKKELIWTCDGVTRRGFLHYPSLVRSILSNGQMPIAVRLARLRKVLCRTTRRLSWTRHIPFLNRLFAEDCIFNLLYAFPSDSLDGYVVGNLSVYNGSILEDSICHTPVILENGMNMEYLTPLSRYLPDSEAPLEVLQKLARKRVYESVEKDRQLLAADSHYRATIGGRIRSISLKK